MYKPRVVFPFVEAGMGHIMPQRAIVDAFEQKYGRYATVIRSDFYKESGRKKLIAFEKMLVREVKNYNKCTLYGWANMFMMHLLRSPLLSFLIMEIFVPGAKGEACAHFEELRPDMVVSTHWSTNYYAQKLDKKPLTALYVPDNYVIPLCYYPSDKVMVSTRGGYKKALKKKHRFNKDNLALVPFAIRNEAFLLPTNKSEARALLGLDEKFTVVLFEGGYGLGKMSKIITALINADVNMNVIAICGKNKKLYDKLSSIKREGKTQLIVKGFCEDALLYVASADVFLGKAGASSVAEPTYFGCAEIITKCATTMEKHNAEHYVYDVKNALRISSVKKIVEKIVELQDNEEYLKSLQENALKVHDEFGSEKTADVLWEMLCNKFPHLKAIKIEEQQRVQPQIQSELKAKQESAQISFFNN